MTRQSSLQMIQQNPSQKSGAQACCWLPFAIACLVIAARGDSEGCEDTFFTVDLVTFLEATGGFQIALLVFEFCVLCCVRKMAGDPSKLALLLQMNLCVGLCAAVFFITWAIIGINSYVNQMSDECQSSPVGIMVFIWSVAMIATYGFACCCICCGFFVIYCVYRD